MTNETLRLAMERIKYKATSLADAQVIALEALTAIDAEQANGREAVAMVDSNMPNGIGWGTPGGSTDPLPDGTLLYTAQPAREWVGLNDYDIRAAALKSGLIRNADELRPTTWGRIILFSSDLIQQLREKNAGQPVVKEN